MHLLLVEDDPRLADLVARLLGGERHLVERAATGRRALELAEAPGLDAIVLDIGLPDISGLEVARELRVQGSRVPILMLTARDAVADQVAGLTPAPTTTSSSHSRWRAGGGSAPRRAARQAGRRCTAAGDLTGQPKCSWEASAWISARGSSRSSSACSAIADTS
jgi:CheY-like chemotaxis protein